MLRSTKELKEYAIEATDGDIGHVKDLYFDDEGWAIRYLIVETGNWLINREVLISPMAIENPNWGSKTLAVKITKEQVKNSPDIDTKKPVSRQYEESYLSYYNYPNYWGGGGLWGVGIYPDPMMQGYVNNTLPQDEKERELNVNRALKAEHERHRNDDIHLRSCNEVIGYQLNATDGEIGHIAEMLVDEHTWAIRYLVVETGHWWSGHKVLIAPKWIDEVQFPENCVEVHLTRQEVKGAPMYDVGVPLSRQFEADTYLHYSREGYWLHEDVERKWALEDS